MKTNSSIVLNIDTSSVQKKLTAIANHAESLVQELEAIDQGIVLASYSTDELIAELARREDVHHVNTHDTVFEIKLDLLEAKKYTVITNNYNSLKVKCLNKMKEAAEEAAKKIFE